MSISLERREDGSLSLFIDGDLQFDSRDERLYHEALVLPALAIAEKRTTCLLKTLVVGGGDGLAARELLKSSRVLTIDLVDYDARVLQLARNELATMNESSLSATRVNSRCEDAWEFVNHISENETYDLVVVDLTVPQDVDGARFHTIEWYQMVSRVLSPNGIIAINGASPCSTTDAYWSIYNSLRMAGLYPKPYRIPLQSFKNYGYGPDWGFFIVGKEPIDQSDLGEDFVLAEPRHRLKETDSVWKMFRFPEAVAARRELSKPTKLGSDLLVSYFSFAQEYTHFSAVEWDALSFGVDRLGVPAADDGIGVFPSSIRAELLQTLEESTDPDQLFERIASLMPPLRRAQTREMISEFLANPARYLDGLDLAALVNGLIKKAAELPAHLVVELKVLRSKIREFLGNSSALLKLGMRITAIIVLVVIMGNLIYPDAAYSKGTDIGMGGISGEPTGLSRPGHTRYVDFAAEPDMVAGDGFRNRRYNNGVSVDERGFVYPSRTYYGYCRSYYSSPRHRREKHERPNPQVAPYRLSPEADILADGTVVIAITDKAYLQIREDASTLIRTNSGEPIVDLYRDPGQVWRIGNEIRRQRLGLLKTIDAKNKWNNWLSWMNFAPWYNEDHVELKNLQDSLQRLDLAEKSLGTIPNQMPPIAPSPEATAIELFSGIWMNQTGSTLIVKRKDGSFCSFNGREWLLKTSRTKELPETNSKALNEVVSSFLKDELKDSAAVRGRLTENLADANRDLSSLERDKRDYNTLSKSMGPTALVEYGTMRIPLKEAIKRTQDDLDKTVQRIEIIKQQLFELPNELVVARQMIDTLSRV